MFQNIDGSARSNALNIIVAHHFSSMFFLYIFMVYLL